MGYGLFRLKYNGMWGFIILFFLINGVLVWCFLGKDRKGNIGLLKWLGFLEFFF